MISDQNDVLNGRQSYVRHRRERLLLNLHVNISAHAHGKKYSRIHYFVIFIVIMQVIIRNIYYQHVNCVLHVNVVDIIYNKHS